MRIWLKTTTNYMRVYQATTMPGREITKAASKCRTRISSISLISMVQPISRSRPYNGKLTKCKCSSTGMSHLSTSRSKCFPISNRYNSQSTSWSKGSFRMKICRRKVCSRSTELRNLRVLSSKIWTRSSSGFSKSRASSASATITTYKMATMTSKTK